VRGAAMTIYDSRLGVRGIPGPLRMQWVARSSVSCRFAPDVPHTQESPPPHTPATREVSKQAAFLFCRRRISLRVPGGSSQRAVQKPTTEARVIA